MKYYIKLTSLMKLNKNTYEKITLIFILFELIPIKNSMYDNFICKLI